MIIAVPPPLPVDVTVVTVQGASVGRVTGAGGATVLAADGAGVVRIAVIRPPGVRVPGPVRMQVRKAGRVRWLARDVVSTPSSRPRPQSCGAFAKGARRVRGPALGAPAGVLMGDVCRLTFRIGGTRAFTQHTGIAVPGTTPTPAPTATPTATPTAVPTATAAPLPNRTGTQLFEYSVHIARNPIAAGDDEIVVTNSGEDDHELAIRDSRGTLLAQTPNLPPRSEPSTMQVTLTPGSYTLFCPLAGHEDLGMKTSLQVG